MPDAKHLFRCIICLRGLPSFDLLCSTCNRAYDEHSASCDGGSIWEVIEWTANRTRKFATGKLSILPRKRVRR